MCYDSYGVGASFKSKSLALQYMEAPWAGKRLYLKFHAECKNVVQSFFIDLYT